GGAGGALLHSGDAVRLRESRIASPSGGAHLSGGRMCDDREGRASKAPGLAVGELVAPLHPRPRDAHRPDPGPSRLTSSSPSPSTRSTRHLVEDGPRGKVELGPPEHSRGHEQRRVAEAEAAADQRLEEGSARAGDARRHASSVTRACRRGGRDCLAESRFVTPGRWPDTLPPPVSEGGAFAASFDCHRGAAGAPPL